LKFVIEKSRKPPKGQKYYHDIDGRSHTVAGQRSRSRGRVYYCWDRKCPL